jgi:hypothetical protein
MAVVEDGGWGGSDSDSDGGGGDGDGDSDGRGSGARATAMGERRGRRRQQTGDSDGPLSTGDGILQVGAADPFSDSGEGERDGWLVGVGCRGRGRDVPRVAVGGLVRAEPRSRTGRGQTVGAAAGSSRGRQRTRSKAEVGSQE